MSTSPGSPESPVVEATEITKVFSRSRQATPAVDSVSFELGRGESLGIVGESGSGKTTLARILVGLEAQTSGVVRVNGVERGPGRVRVAERRRRARETQMVFQDPYRSLDPRQKVASCVEEAVRLYFPDEPDPRAVTSSILASVGLDERIAIARPHALSGGQRQRVAIARALAAKPSVLILDEAVAALDVSVQAQVLGVIDDVRASGEIAVVTITHDLAVARQVADRLMVMKSGRVVEQGGTERVLDAPESEYTKRLVESVPRPGWVPRRRDEAVAGTG